MEFEELDLFGEKVHKKYPYIDAEDVQDIVDKAKAMYYFYKFPSEPSADETTRPIVRFRDKNWINMACQEYVERLGFSSATAYKENGVSWTFDNAQLSDRLVALLRPIVGVIK